MAHAYFRIEERADDVDFAVSADGTSWVSIATAAKPIRTSPTHAVAFAEAAMTADPGSARLRLDQIVWEDCAAD